MLAAFVSVKCLIFLPLLGELEANCWLDNGIVGVVHFLSSAALTP